MQRQLPKQEFSFWGNGDGNVEGASERVQNDSWGEPIRSGALESRTAQARGCAEFLSFIRNRATRSLRVPGLARLMSRAL